MRTLASLFALSLLLVQLAACGSKGPLILPQPQPDSQKTSK